MPRTNWNSWELQFFKTATEFSLLIKAVYPSSCHMAWASSQHGLRQGDFLHADSGLLTTCSREQDGSSVTSCDLASVTDPFLTPSIVQSHCPGLSRSDTASVSQQACRRIPGRTLNPACKPIKNCKSKHKNKKFASFYSAEVFKARRNSSSHSKQKSPTENDYCP